MSSLEALALAALMGQHNVEENARDEARKASETSTEVTFNPASPKPRKGSFNSSDPSHSIHVVKTNGKPAKEDSLIGSMEAHGFTLAMRRAKSRDEQIFALKCYVGYDNTKDFGSQVLAAELKAKRTIREERGEVDNTVTPREKNAAYRNLPGFTPGIPDVTWREVQNLAARETLAASELIALENKAQDKNLPTDQRVLAKGLAKAEGERISHIRKDLQEYGF